MDMALRREVGADDIDLEVIGNGDLGNPFANQILTSSAVFGKS